MIAPKLTQTSFLVYRFNLLHTLFSITGLSVLGLWHVWEFLRPRLHAQKFFCISLVGKKLNFLISIFSQTLYMRGMNRRGHFVNILLFLLFSVNLNIDHSWNNVASQSKWQKFMLEVYFKVPFHKNICNSPFTSTCFIEFT